MRIRGRWPLGATAKDRAWPRRADVRLQSSLRSSPPDWCWRVRIVAGVAMLLFLFACLGYFLIPFIFVLLALGIQGVSRTLQEFGLPSRRRHSLNIAVSLLEATSAQTASTLRSAARTCGPTCWPASSVRFCRENFVLPVGEAEDSVIDVTKQTRDASLLHELRQRFRRPPGQPEERQPGRNRARARDAEAASGRSRPQARPR